MKARKLKELCNNISYIYAIYGDKLCIGSEYCHNLINVDINTLEVKYQLDAFRHGRASLRNDDLIFIWDKLHELIASGEIHDIINGKDTIENPLPVFIADNGVIIESITDTYDWPNVTEDGRLLYDNTSFQTRRQAVEYAIKDQTIGLKALNRILKEREKEYEDAKTFIKEMQERLKNLKKESESD
jgi:uncharacterized coiled-coil protein SlyX